MPRYTAVNITLLGLLLFVPVFTLLSPVAEMLFPGSTLCSYRARTGKPCPFCGLTGDMGKFIATGSVEHTENPRFKLLLPVYLVELPVRGILLVLSLKRLKNTPVIDGAAHFLLLLFLVLRF